MPEFKTRQLQDFIGQGITFPIRVVNGKSPLDSGFELLRSSIITILSWQFGKRFFLTEFGSKLDQLIEEPNDSVLQQTVQAFVVDAISTWERRIESVSCIIKKDTDISLKVTVKYRIISSKAEDTFTFPFYRKIIY